MASCQLDDHDTMSTNPAIDMNVKLFILIALLFTLSLLLFSLNAAHAQSTQWQVFENENPHMLLHDKFEHAKQILLKYNDDHTMWIAYSVELPVVSISASGHPGSDSHLHHELSETTLDHILASVIDPRCTAISSMLFIHLRPIGDKIIVTDACRGMAIYAKLNPTDILYWFGKTTPQQSLNLLDNALQYIIDVNAKLATLDVIGSHVFQHQHLSIFHNMIVHARCERLVSKSVFKLAAYRNTQCDSLLLKLIESSDDTKLVKTIIQSLCQSDNERVIDMLANIAQNNDVPSLQKEAIFSLAQARNKKGLHVLYDLFNTNDDALTKRFILFSLSQSDDKSATAFLLDVLSHHENESIKKEADFWLNNI
ncbi:HEAT repeat domain-containing protein [candidate division KSB1 bacterium]|nr:HEAT repeat domain-containing protein [candidate division KSB1 bacterium]